MNDQYSNEPMLDMFIFETTQLIEQLEQDIIGNEKSNYYTDNVINEIFRIMHTIKGSASMMLFEGIATLAHSIEDLFFFLREDNPSNIDFASINDLVLDGVDFIKAQIEKIKDGTYTDEQPSYLIEGITNLLSALKGESSCAGNSETRPEDEKPNQQYYLTYDRNAVSRNKNVFKAIISFEEDCKRENVRAYTIIHNLKDITQEYYYFPEDIIENDDSTRVIQEKGFTIFFKAEHSFDEMYKFFMQTIFLKQINLLEIDDAQYNANREQEEPGHKQGQSEPLGQNVIGIHVSKLDKLMDLVGELVISEAMVTRNPDLDGLILDNFNKSVRQLRKITSELQDIAMSIRMIPIAPTFYKMHRIVRDMSKKLHKEVDLEIIGEEIEVDKNIIDHIADPLMHIVRNAIDHGMESSEERLGKGKPQTGTITLEAKNAGSDVLVTVKDDGKGLSRESILAKARKNDLLSKPEFEMSDREVCNLILLPGFTTKESITEFSGRGVGMDVVTRNIESIGGSVYVDSAPDKGTTITMKIPLTLAIIGGMNIKVGDSYYTIPISSIIESFRSGNRDVITDPDDHEMIMVRGQCYPIIRLHQRFKIRDTVTEFSKGIFVMVEGNNGSFCIFADQLIGEQQVVVKALPNYIRSLKMIQGLAGCTLLGDGKISLILDIAGLYDMSYRR